MLNVEKGREVRKGGDCGLRNNRDGELGGLATWRENRIGKGLTRRRQDAKKGRRRGRRREAGDGRWVLVLRSVSRVGDFRFWILDSRLRTAEFGMRSSDSWSVEGGKVLDRKLAPCPLLLVPTYRCDLARETDRKRSHAKAQRRKDWGKGFSIAECGLRKGECGKRQGGALRAGCRRGAERQLKWEV